MVWHSLSIHSRSTHGHHHHCCNALRPAGHTHQSNLWRKELNFKSWYWVPRVFFRSNKRPERSDSAGDANCLLEPGVTNPWNERGLGFVLPGVQLRILFLPIPLLKPLKHCEPFLTQESFIKLSLLGNFGSGPINPWTALCICACICRLSEQFIHTLNTFLNAFLNAFESTSESTCVWIRESHVSIGHLSTI